MFLKKPYQCEIMISPKVYEQQINDLEIEGMEISPNNSDDANVILKNLLNIEDILQRIRYNVRMDIRAIRKDYINNVREIENSKKSIKIKKKDKRNLIEKRDVDIVPYEDLEYILDDYLRQIDLAKNYIIDYLKQ